MARRDDAPRDLIFGLLALQNGMITRDQLVAAFGVWTASARPLSALLVEQGALTAHRRDVLDALAAEHVAVHGGDPEATLAALDVEPSTRDTLALAAGQDVELSLARVGSTRAEDPDRPAAVYPTAEHWRQVCDAFATLLCHDPAHRAAYLESACGGDPAVRADVEALLASHTPVGAGRFLDVPEPARTRRDSPGSDPAASTTEFPADAPVDASRRFRHLRPHARGGLGAVFVALDTELNREVALKQICDDHADNPSYCGRFLREAEITGRLEHPAIVPVYSVGRLSDGKPYYAMRLIRGITMAEAIARFHSDRAVQADPGRRTLELRKLLGRFLTVCDAAAYAHGRGVLHRDLKPSNVMLGAYGETLVVDWGLAKATGFRDPMELVAESTLRPGTADGTTDTAAGTRLGTPSYMSPEQVAGRLEDIGPASDVYSLGATLYTLLTGVPPQTERDLPTLLARLERGDVASPRTIRPWIDPALESVCLKAISPRPTDRYESVRAMAEDLQNWLADEPVSAWREPRSRRLGRWAKRHRTSVTAAAMSLALCVVAVVYLLNESRLRREQRQTTAEGRVAALLTSEVREIPRIIAELSADLHLVRDRLQAHSGEEQSPRNRLGSSLALLPVDPSRAEFLVAWALTPVATPEEVLVIREALHAHARQDDRVRQRILAILKAPNGDGDVKLRAAGLLARLDPEDPCWPDQAKAVAHTLARENPLRIDSWREMFQPVAHHLSVHLIGLVADGESTEADDRAFALVLGWGKMPGYPRGPEDIAALMADSEPTRLAELVRSLGGANERDRAVVALKSWVNTAAVGDAGLAGRQGRIAGALMRLGEFESIWPLLRQVPDSGTRAEVIEQFALNSVDPGLLIARLATEKDAPARRSLVLALGNYPRKAIPPDQLPSLKEALHRWYRDSPDAGLHGAVGWLLREVWGLGLSLGEIDRELATDSIPDDREWFVSRRGETFTIIRGPVTFRVGSSKPANPDGSTDEPQFEVRIPRSYAIASREVTLGDYSLYLDDRADRGHDIRGAFGFSRIFPYKDGAAGMVTWYAAASYCNWLSQREGLPESQWCYPRRCEPGMLLPPDHLERIGYRLPTEYEWEYACKAGSILAPRHFGQSDLRLTSYAWFTGNTKGPMCRVGMKKPNDFGLFDMLGNAFEWCLGQKLDPPPRLPGPAIEDRVSVSVISDDPTQAIRGGAFNNPAVDVRSARHIYIKPSSEYHPVGFRVVRTCPRPR